MEEKKEIQAQCEISYRQGFTHGVQLCVELLADAAGTALKLRQAPGSFLMMQAAYKEITGRDIPAGTCHVVSEPPKKAKSASKGQTQGQT